MNRISKIHKLFSECLNDPEILTRPENFLGENYEAVLNFWLILDELSEEQIKAVNERYGDFYNNQYSEWKKALDEAIKASEETIGRKFAFNAAWAVWVVTNSAARFATRELIGMHKILEDHQQPLTFFELFLEVL